MEAEVPFVHMAPSLSGRILIARPELHDPNFDATLTLILEHSDEGALGLVLNRPSRLTMADAFPDWEDYAATPDVVFAGYAGWAAGQLEGEIANHGWWVVDAEIDDLFTDDPTRLWAKVLQRQGGELAWYAHFPVDPSLN